MICSAKSSTQSSCFSQLLQALGITRETSILLGNILFLKFLFCIFLLLDLVGLNCWQDPYSWFSLSIIETNCLGLCSMILILLFKVSPASFIFCPHLLQASTSIDLPSDLIFLGTRREPQLKQKSIKLTPFSGIGKLIDIKSCDCMHATTKKPRSLLVNALDSPFIASVHSPPVCL